MKVHTSYFELVMIMVFIIAGVPLLIQLMGVCKSSVMDYMEDKTMYKLSDSIDYQYDPTTKQYLPINLAPILLDRGEVRILPYIQDKFCPTDGLSFSIYPNANKPSYVPVSGERIYTMMIEDGWLAKKDTASQKYYNNTDACLTDMSPYYLVWNSYQHRWMITHKFINIFQED